MNLNNIQYCPSTLAPGFHSYSPKAMNDLFGSRTKKVSHLLPFPAPGKDVIQTKVYNEKRKAISISGYQEKYSIQLKKNTLELVDKNGHYILKPIPTERLSLVNDMPANEHLTMQIASQVFKIYTASNGLIFFEDGSPAYLTKRFDYRKDGLKYQIEDFATLIGLTRESDGDEFKIKASYATIAATIDKFVPAAKIEKLNFFELVVFNYAFGNGDAHLKNFSLLETLEGDYILSPAYDLICTALHIDDGNLALQGGLYEKDFEAPAFSSFGFYTYHDFILFGELIGLELKLTEPVLKKYSKINDKVLLMIERSFLSKKGKKLYQAVYLERMKRFNLFL
jgi:serine/threonine-protein kinase HipA